MKNKIIVINGPNLNLLGEREEDKYGKISLQDVENNCKEFSKKNEIEIEFFQSNIEGEIVNSIQNSRDEKDGLIINAGGYTHTSVAILDALKVLKIPIIELHITNIYNREDFRHKSLISKVATGIVCGFGTNGYIMALDAIKKLTKKMKIDKKLIKELVDNLSEFNLTELEYQDGEKKIKVSRASRIGSEQIKTGAVISGNKSVLANKSEEDGIRIKSPIIGTAYLAPEPGAKKFVEIGQKIKKGQTIMIVEAMKTMNHVPSTSDGTVKEILVNDGQSVEFGQPLIILN